MSALYEVQVVPIVAARPHQDAQEVQVVAEVLEQRRPGAGDTRGDIAGGRLERLPFQHPHIYGRNHLRVTDS